MTQRSLDSYAAEATEEAMLADDLADVLAKVAFFLNREIAEMERVLARYREARK